MPSKDMVLEGIDVPIGVEIASKELNDALKEYQDHIQGGLFAGSLLLGPLFPTFSTTMITDYLAGVANLSVFSAITYASLEYDSKHGEGAFEQNMKEEAVQTAVEATTLPVASVVDPTGISTVVSIVERIKRWFK